MARIRTIKPEFFRHIDLYEAERETGLPLRVAFIGLWTVADREGRFRWEPHALKLDCLPFDVLDFSRVLDALATRGFVVKYASRTDGGKRTYGYIPSFRKHQVINTRERASELPDPDDSETIQQDTDASSTCEARVTDMHVRAQGEREKEREKEGEGKRKKDAPDGASKDFFGTDSNSTEPEPPPKGKSATATDAETDLFKRGKEILGKDAGGLIRRLLRAKGGKVALARAAVETASTKQDPREYVGACLRQRRDDDGLDPAIWRVPPGGII